MDFFEVVQKRHSTRAFAARPVESEKLQAILEAANQAPSAGNLQAYEIYLVTRPATLKALADAAQGQEYVAQAPVALAFFAHPRLSSRKYGQRGTSLYAIQDGTIACAHAHLAATALELASVWVGAFNDDAVREAIGAGADLLPLAILPIGYPAEKPESTSRRSLTEMVHRIS
jgi:nitroreductase